MTDRDRLAADLHTMHDRITVGGEEGPCQCIPMADRLIALGWTRLDEERLARALHRLAFGGGADAVPDYPYDVGFLSYSGESTDAELAARIAKAYREENDA